MRSPLLLALAAVIVAAQEENRCSDRSCFPVTGNLLVGRKHRLWATSTCGLTKRERFCIVSHLEEQTKCFYCDSRHEWKPNREPYRLSHRIENVVTDVFDDKTRNWWQSENGMQNVSVRLDLEAEFHFTHLIMTFKSFRPAAMLIERSSDFGKTWSVYRYFAYDCQSSFPGIPEGPPKKHTDVICTRAYSEVAPSTGGELVYKVISPHIATVDPYSEEISNLLKVTNIRFNFTKLHTLGDDLLDYRPEIDEKYYYAIYEIVVRGSCSCYGHAQRCIPIDGGGVGVEQDRPDVVHGRCECNHNTQGLNCEKCQDFYNDLPWRPAIGEDTNECRRCDCNGHAARCHFDKAVYEASGFVSGGVCDDCGHNTQGKNCEQCKPYFYRDPRRPITDAYVCLQCECDKAGSVNDGICEGEEDPERGLVAGKCYCKNNVDGPRCDRCKNGFWNLSATDPDGCIACTCNLLGTWNNQGCDKRTGSCQCKRLVTGESCDRCLPEHYGLSEEADGCRACDCDIGGSFDNNCDILSGQCKCREGFGGRRCDSAESGFFCANIDHYTYEAEFGNITYGEVEPRELPVGHQHRTWTGEGFVRATERTAVSFEIDDIQISKPYSIVLRYEAPRDQVGWENVLISVVRPENQDPNGPCGHVTPNDDFIKARLYPGHRYHEVRSPICLEAGLKYEIRVEFGEKRTGAPDRAAAILFDSIVLAPPTEELDIFKGSSLADYHRQEYERYQCRNLVLALSPKEQLSEVCTRYICPVAATVFNKTIECDCDKTGTVSGICNPLGGQCECKANVVGRRCDKCSVGTYGFGPSGCTECECDSVGSLHNRCDLQSGQCVCREKGITGRQCNQCQPGFWNFPDCQVCQCNNHAVVCDQTTGACIECRDLTSGHHCDRCQEGYYGDPRLGVDLPCKPCPCPGGPASGYQHADTCYLQPAREVASQDVVCNCRPGYTGERCDECAVNFWGNPTEVGGSCVRCDCNGNIDMNVAESCDASTGDCVKCLHNTEGVQCENCVEGFYGDAKIRSCQRCVCNQLGTNVTAGACNRVSGQCQCFPHVKGQQCDQCEENHYDIASGQGCAGCDCDPQGVVTRGDGTPELQCNEIDGRCPCKAGRGGRRCNECEDYHWGDPTKDECQRCECNHIGAATMQCHRSNGTCVCKPGSGGPLCDECARGYTGQWPNCEPCGECFRSWDNIVQNLRQNVEAMIEKAANIEDTGVASVYDDQFTAMEKNLEEVKAKLAEANITKDDIDHLDKQIELLKAEVATVKSRMEEVESAADDVERGVDFAEQFDKDLAQQAAELTEKTQQLSDNMTQLKEADVQGAYNSTRESADKSISAQARADKAHRKLTEAETIRSETEALLAKNQEDFEKFYAENEVELNEREIALDEFEAQLPSLNNKVCGASSAPCDALCGGPGACGHCGGRSCLEGAVSQAEQAFSFAEEADQKLFEKQAEAEQVLTRVRDSFVATADAKREAAEALGLAKKAAKDAQRVKNETQAVLAEINEFLNNQNRSSPDQIRALAEDVLKFNIDLTPEKIRELSEKIRTSLAKLNNIEEILAETRGNKSAAANLEALAKAASDRAALAKNITDEVRTALAVAQEAQAKAKAAIENARAQLEQAKADLALAKNETASAEATAKDTETSLQDLETSMKAIQVQYLKTGEDVKNAFATADSALQLSSTANSLNDQLTADIATARGLLSKRDKGESGNEDRAVKLRGRAGQLLYKAQKFKDDIDGLMKDAVDVRLDDQEETISQLTRRLDTVMKAIQEKVDFYSLCG